MSIYKGSGVAIVTPMKANEEVNYDKLEELIEEQISEGTDCIVIAGTTGESSTLSQSNLCSSRICKTQSSGSSRNRF